MAKGPLSQNGLIPPARNICNIFIRNIASRVLLGASQVGTSAQHVPKFPTSRRKADVQHKLHSLYKYFKHNEPLLLVLELVGTLLKSMFADTSQGPTLQAGLPKNSHLRPAIVAFLHNGQKIHLNLKLISYTNIKSKCNTELNT